MEETRKKFTMTFFLESALKCFDGNQDPKVKFSTFLKSFCNPSVKDQT